MRLQRFLPPSATHLRQSPLRLTVMVLAVTMVLWCLPPGAAVAQAKKAAAKTGKKAEKKEEIPEPEQVDLRSGDGVALRATFFPGTKKKQSVPVILLHMWKGNHSSYSELAGYLQRQGHAVLVPDLRGHGGSTAVENSSMSLDAATMPPAEFVRMVTHDMETLKSFLLKKNDAAELNIDKLCVVGAEMGASVALEWARVDWSWPPLATGKQGQDVKALVLISPQWSFRGLQIKEALIHPRIRSDLSVLIVVGKGRSRSVREARRLYSAFNRHHPDPPPEKRREQQDLFYLPLDTSLQGTKMLGVRSLKLEQRIARFIELRLVDKSFPWKKRRISF